MISSHVLDLATGLPAAGVPVVLEFEAQGSWRELARAVTDADGRARELGGAPAPGRVRLRFEVAAHLAPDAFFDEVTVQFVVADVEQPLHVPLLLSPYGYSTYRGS